MNHEGLTTPEIELEFAQEAEQIIAAHGGEEYFQEHFGFGREELQQTVVFGSHRSSVARMLTDEKCPIGGKLAEAYHEGGTEAVQTKINQLSEIAPEFTLTITNSSWEREAKKKEPEPLLEEKPEPTRAETTIPGSDRPPTELRIRQRVVTEEMTTLNSEVKKGQDPPAVINELADKPLYNETVPISVPEAKPITTAELGVVDVGPEEVLPVQTVGASKEQVIPSPVIAALQKNAPEFVPPLSEPLEVMELGSEIVFEPVAGTSRESEASLTIGVTLPKPLLNEESSPTTETVAVSEAVAAIVPLKALTHKQLVQTEQLVTSLAVIVYDQLADYMHSAEPEAIEAAEVLVVSIAAAANRLHKLTMSDELNSPEAEQIETLIREWYEELLTKAGINFDEETIDQFIELVKSEDYGQDKGTHEHKLPDSALPGGVTSSAVREQEIGRVAVQRLMPA